MKSSTLNRSEISKERIEALDELLSNQSSSYDSSPGVYVRSDKDRELDILWQGFKINSKEERSPGVYLSIGFVTGAICMFLMTTILNFGKPSTDNVSDLNLWKKGNVETQQKKDVNINVTPATSSESATSSTDGRTESYKVESGDSLERIAIKFYGSSTPEKIQKIQTANSLSSPDTIKIGQELQIPVE